MSAHVSAAGVAGAAPPADSALAAPCGASDAEEVVHLVCREGVEDHSILSTLRNGWDSIIGDFEHALLRFFTMEEAAVLRLLCREFEDAVSITPFRVLRRVVQERHLPGWLTAFPNAGVQEVILVGTSISRLDATALAAALPSMAALRTLNLNQCYIGAAGMSTIAGAFPSMTALTTLDAGSNALNNSGAEVLAKALPDLTALKTLSLSSNLFDDTAAVDFAMELPSLRALASLCLRRNFIGDVGIQWLFAALPRCGALASLDLSGNSFEDEGARAIAVALPSMAALTSLNVAWNYITDAGEAALVAAVRAGCTLEYEVQR